MTFLHCTFGPVPNSSSTTLGNLVPSTISAAKAAPLAALINTRQTAIAAEYLAALPDRETWVIRKWLFGND